MNCSSARNEMVDTQIEARGVRDCQVLAAMRTVPREVFLAKHLQEFAYSDNPLPIGSDQTISQPYIVAFMIEALDLSGGERVLEIGTGCGYSTAVLAEIAGEVYTVERILQLARQATKSLQGLGYRNIHIRYGDGTCGWAEFAPFDAIIVTAGGPRIPESLKTQLRTGGRMVIPIGSSPHNQKLVRIVRTSDSRWKTRDIAGVRFVPLIGQEGWACKKSPE